MSDFWADQRQAARRETGRIFGAVAEAFEATEIREATWGKHTDLWRQTIADNLEHNRMRMCQHLHITLTQPALIVAHKLDRMLCEPCAMLVLSAEYNEIEDNTCDVCHRYDPEGIYPVAHQTGTLIVTGGICESCRATD